MADPSSTIYRLLNPCLLHLQKMGLELRCPACLKFFSDPVLLPCSHICCRSCLMNQIENQKICPACKTPLTSKGFPEPRTIPLVETMVTIFKSMNSTFAHLVQPSFQGDAFEIMGRYGETPVSCNPVNELTSRQVFKDSIDKINTQSSNIVHVACPCGKEPCSPLSFGDLKYSEDDSNDSGNVHKLPSNTASKRKADSDASDKTQFRAESTHGDPALDKMFHSELTHQNISGTDKDISFLDPVRESKKFKLDSESHDNSRNSCDNLEIEPNKNFDIETSVSDSSSMACVFCHSSVESEELTGSMLHYDEYGNAVKNNQPLQPNILHVHQKCIDWAPQIYFDGDIARNIECEVLRASKIKCSKCHKKGAALGCYNKSCRRSYHVPCALLLSSSCRWDVENFLLLCPNHVSKKFPSDRSKVPSKEKSTNSSVNLVHRESSENPAVELSVEDMWMPSLDVTRGWVLCGSALSTSENILLSKFATMIGASVSKDWRPNVTHVIASTDDLGACSRTLKYLMAILRGKWILRVEWIKACYEARRLVDEESYEVIHDIHGCFDGPKNGRIRIMEKAPPLFGGLSFYFHGHFKTSYKGYLKDLILVGGGRILEKISSTCDSKSVVPTSFVVYNLDHPEACVPMEQADEIRMRLEEAGTIAACSGSQAIAHTWVLDSIAACKLQPLIL